MLGSSAEGRWKCEVGDDGVMNEEAEGRMQQAVAACVKLKQLAEMRLALGSSQAAWAILQKSVARALDFDCRLCPAWAFAVQRA
eukprot:9019940-Lingulodinium_polyedra.AAC.1